MSHQAQVSAFRPTAFDTVANNFWQDYLQGNPIGGGAAYESKIRELTLDGSLESLKQLDRLFLAIKKDLQKRGYDEKLVLQQTSFRNLLLFVMFYAGKVVAHQLKEGGSWQPLANMEQYYPSVSFSDSENKFYFLAAYFPQSFLADVRMPPMFVLLTLGAKLFGSFERQFVEPLSGEIVPESIYWAVAGYLHIVGQYRKPIAQPTAAPVSRLLPNSEPTQPTAPQTGQGIPSKIAQTAPKPINKPQTPQTQPAGIRPSMPVAGQAQAGQIRPASRVHPNAPQAMPTQGEQVRPMVRPDPRLTPPQTQVVPPVSPRVPPQAQAQPQLQPQIRPQVQPQAQPQPQPRPQVPQPPSQAQNQRVIAPSLDLQSRDGQVPQPNVPSQPAPRPQVAPPPAPQPQPPIRQQAPQQGQGIAQPPQTPRVPQTTAHAQVERAMHNPAQKPQQMMNLHMHGEPTRPAPPPAEHHKEHRFQAGGLAPMTLAPPIVTVKAQPVAPQPAPTAPVAPTQNSVQNGTAAPVVPAPQPQPTPQPQKQPTAPPPPKADVKPVTPTTKKSKGKSNSDENLFSEVLRDLINLPAVNAPDEVRYQKVKAALDKYDETLAEKVAKGEREIVFTDQEMSDIQRAVYNVKKLADAGHTGAMISYGLCCFKGVAMPQDMEQGAVWVQKAAEMNDVRAQKFLSRLYYQGLGVEQSIRQGESWLEKAAANGHPEAKKIQAQFSHIKVMKDDYKVESQKDKRFAMILMFVGIVIVLALWALKAFI